MQNIEKNFLPPSADLKEAIRAIESSRVKVALVVDPERRLLGTITDGDVRRAILNGAGLADPVTNIMNASPRVGHLGDDRGPLIDLMRRNICRHIPILDADRRVVAIETLEELVAYGRRANCVVLMAGGLGKRLRPLTDDMPKPMLPVGDTPLLQLIIESFRDQGFNKFYVSVNYLGHKIQDHFGDGSEWGVSIDYLCEDKPLGTAGALALLPERPTTPIIVMNGDILTKVDFRQLLQFHDEHKAQATMCVRDYFVEVPFGVIDNDGHRIREFREKPRHRFLVNAGIYTLEPDVLDHIPRDEFYDMPSLIETLVARGQHACLFPVREYWLDVGRMDDFDRARREYLTEFDS